MVMSRVACVHTVTRAHRMKGCWRVFPSYREHVLSDFSCWSSKTEVVFFPTVALCPLPCCSVGSEVVMQPQNINRQKHETSCHVWYSYARNGPYLPCLTDCPSLLLTAIFKMSDVISVQSSIVEGSQSPCKLNLCYLCLGAEYLRSSLAMILSLEYLQCF